MDRRGVLRRLTFMAALAVPLGLARAAPPAFARVRPRGLVFPADHGAHPEFRTEWWYATGWLDVAGEALGFQITFFRSRSTHDADNPSRFAPHQLLFAHAALASPVEGRLRHAQRGARVVRGDESTRFSLADTELALPGWRFWREADDSVRATVDAESVKFDLRLAPTQPILLQGEAGLSRKGARPEQASHYYSRPQLATTGRVWLAGQWREASGRAWLDHEWSSDVLDTQAVGWDWIGINLDDGGALMAFCIRGRDGGLRWAAARVRDADGRERTFDAANVRVDTLRQWRSPHTGTTYPVESRWSLGAGPAARSLRLMPLMDDQELDSRATTGAVYWEGAVTAFEGERRIGRGYLELVGYHRPMTL